MILKRKIKINVSLVCSNAPEQLLEGKWQETTFRLKRNWDNVHHLTCISLSTVYTLQYVEVERELEPMPADFRWEDVSNPNLDFSELNMHVLGMWEKVEDAHQA